MDAYIKRVTWLRRRQPRVDLYIYAFIVSVAGFLHSQLYEQYELWLGAVWCLALLLAALVYLSQEWSLLVKSRLQYAVSTPAQAQYLLIEPAGVGAHAIVQLQQPEAGQRSRAAWLTVPHRRFVFHSLVFEVTIPDTEAVTIRRLDYPDTELIAWYAGWKGWASCEAAAAEGRWGRNAVDLPLPSFATLFREHATAPLFVFQLVCVVLWSLDEYFLYSLWTLFMLVALEATLVFQRIKTAQTLRGMRPAPYPLHVFRDGAWKVLQSDALVPLDIVSLHRLPAGSRVASTTTPPVSAKAESNTVCPADVLLLAGGLVVNEAMLTGESTALTKEAADFDTRGERLDAFDMASDRNHVRHIVFSGTSILQKEEYQENPSGIPLPPDGGAIGVVLHTGSGSVQADLLRTIVHGADRVSAADRDALIFIAVLLMFAVAASGYVLHQGLQDPKRDRWALVLHCIMILTSVVPPELPVELSLAVNNSLAVLMRRGIYCIEPFRIPAAGKVDICCFDKTGTLTADEFVVRSITVMEPGAAPKDVPVRDCPDAARLVLLGCHSLVGQIGADATSSSTQPIGDPIETAAVTSLGWTVDALRMTRPVRADAVGRGSIRILHRWPFSATLKRMSCVVAPSGGFGSVTAGADSNRIVVVKGAPEAVFALLSNPPAEYHDQYNRLAGTGARVLALAYRTLSSRVSDAQIGSSVTRETAEAGLKFAGFLAVSSPCKTDSARTVKALQESGHRVVMITGDAPLTAVAVAAQLGMRANPATAALSSCAILDMDNTTGSDSLHLNMLRSNGKQETVWRGAATAAATIPLQAGTLCITGPALQSLRHSLPPDPFNNMCRAGTIFARVSPAQKEWVICAFNAAGHKTAMVGDGSNDTAALKQAHVGVAVVSNPALEKKYDQARLKQLASRAAGPRAQFAIDDDTEIEALLQSERSGKTTQPADPAAAPAPPKNTQEVLTMIQDQLQRMEAEGDGGPSTVALGDASMAAPFTSKLPTPSALLDIIRQGRCTLVSVQTMYQILAINSLVLSYMMSVLYLYNVKSSDTQATVSGMSAAFFFLLISWAKPLQRLSPERPHPSVFNPRLLLSITLQFAVHLAALVTTVQIITPLLPAASALEEQTAESAAVEVAAPSLDSAALSKILGDIGEVADGSSPALPAGHGAGGSSSFVPNVVSSAVFVVSTAVQTCTFVASYYGLPFMEPLSSQSWLVRGAIVVYSICVLGALGLSDDLNEYLQLVPLPEEWQRQTLAAIIVGDALAVFAIDAAIRAIVKQPRLQA